MLRAVQEFVVHIESFRNVDIWYQGAYLLCLQIYTETREKKEKVYAHPFAFTQHYKPGDYQSVVSQNQVIKNAFIDNSSSSFLSKSFLLKYYEQQVQVNDICHFRVESDISNEDHQYVLQMDLLFYEQQIKKIDPGEITIEKGKRVRSKKFVMRQGKAGVHEYVQAIFDGQYYSIANVMVHSVCLDYRFRMCKLQLSEFSRLAVAEKKRLLDRNKKMHSKEISYLKIIAGQLGIAPNSIALQTIEEIVIKDMKKHYHLLLKEYSLLFSRVITEYHRKTFQQLIVHPSQLGLFQDESFKGNVWQDQLYKRYKTNNEEEVIEKMLNEANLISSEMIKLWHHFIDLLKLSPRFTVAHYETLCYQKLNIFWQKFMKLQNHKVVDFCISSQQNHQIDDKLQKELHNERMNESIDLNVFNEDWLTRKNTFPLMIQNFYAKQQQSRMLQIEEEMIIKNEVSLHLVVLVHGFQGNSLDMKLIKNNISIMYPQAAFLCATSNQDMTDTDIIEMGHRLATEIKNHIIEFFPPDTLQRISFVGHSLGGVIIRAALPRLLDLKGKFHTFITFSSPHIGYKVNASSVIEAGIWVLQKFKNSNCLKQLTMHDNLNPRETCLYRISKFQGLAYFKNIFLFSSRQDSYAPYQSSRIEIHPDFMNAKDPLKQVHCEMVRNILCKVPDHVLKRIRVNFCIEQTNIDSIIGRAAHIFFLQNGQLIQMFLNSHPRLFE